LFSREADRIDWLHEHMGHLCEDMESVAVYKACAACGVPVLGPPKSNRGRRIIPVIGMMKDKDVEGCIALYADLAKEAVATQVDYPRAMPHEELCELLKNKGVNAVSESTIPAAVERAKKIAGEDGIVLVCGSLYVVGEVRLMLKGDDGRL